ncbi:hypothetical protein [Candidatus Uabimicrobium amorphum]|uniref:Uncharacterized protein n=1 Tax=Uabimicrobium amorphum TaxID=2596890 RepID=A0A5S9IVJ2_UABAM|nr:hypothetical protein [Candidatus Uabimicrobium amorphum]BBM87345.1 hypothetical protein UABAM_05754 [Candidatus Uabimicrobium amorphum]
MNKLFILLLFTTVYAQTTHDIVAHTFSVLKQQHIFRNHKQQDKEPRPLYLAQQAFTEAKQADKEVQMRDRLNIALAHANQARFLHSASLNSLQIQKRRGWRNGLDTVTFGISSIFLESNEEKYSEDGKVISSAAYRYLLAVYIARQAQKALKEKPAQVKHEIKWEKILQRKMLFAKAKKVDQLTITQFKTLTSELFYRSLTMAIRSLKKSNKTSLINQYIDYLAKLAPQQKKVWLQRKDIVARVLKLSGAPSDLEYERDARTILNCEDALRILSEFD